LYLISSKDGAEFSQPQKLGNGTWKINACPMDGGGIAHEGSRTLTAWRREKDVYLAEPGKPEVKLGEGKDVAIAASDMQVYVLWISNHQLQLWVDGKTKSFAENASLPGIVSLSHGGVLVAWEENGGIYVKQVSRDGQVATAPSRGRVVESPSSLKGRGVMVSAGSLVLRSP